MTLRENFNHRLGKQIVVDITPEFQIVLQAPLDDILNRWNLQASNIAISLVRQDFNVEVYDIFYKQNQVTAKIARIFTTKAPKKLITRLENEQSFVVNPDLFIVQAIRLIQNPIISDGVYETVQVNSLADAKDNIENFVKSQVMFNSEGFQMNIETKVKNQEDPDKNIIQQQIVTRLTEKVKHDDKYIPVTVEYVFDADLWAQGTGNKNYRLALVRFPQDLYEK